MAEERKREALQRQAAERDARRTSAGIPPRFRNAALDGVPAELARFADDPASMPAGFILLGPPGTGKTYAACAVAIALADARKWAAYMTAKHAVRRVKAMWRKDAESTEEMVADWFRGLDLLILDEAGADLGGPLEAAVVTDIVSDRHAEEKPTILIGNLAPGDLASAYGDRVVDRYREGGKVLVFSGPSRRGRANAAGKA